MKEKDQKSFEEYVSTVKKFWSINTEKRINSEDNNDFNTIDEFLQVYGSLSIGEYFMYIIDPNKGTFEYVSSQAESILGYKLEEYSAELCVQMVHPEDLEYVIDIQNKISNFSMEIIPEERTNYKFTYDFRVLDVDGGIHQIHLQHFFYELGKKFLPNRVICIATDITLLKVGGVPKMHIYNIKNGLNNLLNPDLNSSLQLTKKEKEIIEFLIKGYTSQDIADAMKLSKHTVDTHRRNMLKKNDCSNTSELFSLYFKK
ncbi:LuxR C-terminal-related transcriptional regulator [Empedobacter brevis]|uniref:LuxR C-terminal-related transcriptional regulator n=1 Tax=Empedobacter brevis TaxID=247 RepID=UPI0039B01D56